MKQKELCEKCNNSKLEYVNGNEPYTIDYLICPKCDSTYNIFDYDYEFCVDFYIGDKVYADCLGMGQSGILVEVIGDIALVDFGGTYGIMKTTLKSVSPYDIT